MSDKNLRARLGQQLDAIRAQGLAKKERLLTGPQGSAIRVGDREVINFCANNYLGLANHPAIVEAAMEGLRRYGYGMASVRFICGTQECTQQLRSAPSPAFSARTTPSFTAPAGTPTADFSKRSSAKRTRS